MNKPEARDLDALVQTCLHHGLSLKSVQLYQLHRAVDGLIDWLAEAPDVSPDEVARFREALAQVTLAGGARASADSQDAPSDKSMADSGITVLVCDDDLTIEILARAALEQLDIRTLFAATAEDALELYLQEPVDAVVTDVCLPGNDGYWLIEQVITHRRNEGLPRIPMITISGQVDTAEALTMLVKVGGLFHQEKPADWAELAYWIANACRKDGGAPPSSLH